MSRSKGKILTKEANHLKMSMANNVINKNEILTRKIFKLMMIQSYYLRPWSQIQISYWNFTSQLTLKLMRNLIRWEECFLRFWKKWNEMKFWMNYLRSLKFLIQVVPKSIIKSNKERQWRKHRKKHLQNQNQQRYSQQSPLVKNNQLWLDHRTLKLDERRFASQLDCQSRFQMN